MKTVATPSMIAVPSMLIVAPSGTENEATESPTPSRFLTVASVSGRVAPLDAVLNANINTARILVRKPIGLSRANRRISV